MKIAPHGNSKGGVSYDLLYAMMVMCKESEGKNAPEAFVRMVNAAPFPMVVLAFDWTLDDLVRFARMQMNFVSWGLIQPSTWDHLTSPLPRTGICYYKRRMSLIGIQQ